MITHQNKKSNLIITPHFNNNHTLIKKWRPYCSTYERYLAFALSVIKLHIIISNSRNKQHQGQTFDHALNQWFWKIREWCDKELADGAMHLFLNVDDSTQHLSSQQRIACAITPGFSGN